jgi:hypothetical protein
MAATVDEQVEVQLARCAFCHSSSGLVPLGTGT